MHSQSPPLDEIGGSDTHVSVTYNLGFADPNLNTKINLGKRGVSSGFASGLVRNLRVPAQPSLLQRLFWDGIRCFNDLLNDGVREQKRYRKPVDAGPRAQITFPGLRMTTASPAYLAGAAAFPAAISEASFGFFFSFEQVGDGDWLELSLDDATLWAGIGTDFTAGSLYEASVPSELLAGKSGLLSFVLHSEGDAPAQVIVGSTEGATEELTETFQLSGLFEPVDNSPVTNAMKAGAAVPLKFSLGGDFGLDVLAAGYPQSRQVACSAGGVVDSVEETVSAGGSTLSYDSASAAYTYVWKTEKAWAGTCRELRLRLVDGQELVATFSYSR